MKTPYPSLQDILGSARILESIEAEGVGPAGSLPLTDEMLRSAPSGHLFGLTQNAGMGWPAEKTASEAYLIVSTQGGVQDADGKPLLLGYHTGHWEVGEQVKAAAAVLRSADKIPFGAFCTDPCDGRTQGTDGMMDSLPYRNDAAIVVRRLIRSLPTRAGVMAIGTCDKGLPALMLGLAGCSELPGIVVPGGVTLPATNAEDAGKVQSLGARYAHGMVSIEYAARVACQACGSTGGGCQFLGTAASSQVAAEALGIALPHTALHPAGQEISLDLAGRSALALLSMAHRKLTLKQILTEAAVENAMLINAAFGGSTNLLLHIPAIAHAAGLPSPAVSDWERINRACPRLVDALPNGPRNYPTIQVFLAGGVPEVMLYLRDIGVLNQDVLTVSGEKLSTLLDWWEQSKQRKTSRQLLRSKVATEPKDVIMRPRQAKRRGLVNSMIFPVGNLAPEGSVIKVTALDPELFSDKGIFYHKGPARIFCSEDDAIKAIKKPAGMGLKSGDVIVLIGIGPVGTGMEEIYQITSALKFLPWANHIPVLTDGRFSGVSTGACIGHIGPEALAGGPVGRLRDGDLIEIRLDRRRLRGSLKLVGTPGSGLSDAEARALLQKREPHPGLRPDPNLPADTRLWAILQSVSGGTWAGSVYDIDAIADVVERGRESGPAI